jgi:putative ribosome biogenesis GTPase RsgA
MDVLSEEETEIVGNIEAIYLNIGYETLEISSYSKQNLDILEEKIKNRTSVFLDIQVVGNLLWLMHYNRVWISEQERFLTHI